MSAGAAITGRWAAQVVEAVDGRTNEAGIRAALGAVGDRFDVDALAKLVEEELFRGTMLGVLDVDWEVEHEDEIGLVKFAPTPGTEAPPTVHAPFTEAIADFRNRNVMPRPAFDLLERDAKRKAFTVARLAKQELLDAAHAELVRQLGNSGKPTRKDPETGKWIYEGPNFREFKMFVRDRLESAGWTPANPSHVECLPGETLVSGAMVRAAHRRRYEGTMVEVVTASGRKFTATPNHPMLTRSGWVGAGSLCEGDDLIGHRWQQRAVPSGDQDIATPPASISEVFRACEQVGSLERIRSSDEDFHGDGRDGDVDIASPDGMLRVGRFAALREPTHQDLFAPSLLARSRFCAACGHLNVITQRCGFCGTPERDAGEAQHSADRVVAGAEFSRQVVRAFTAEVAPHDLLSRKILSDTRGETSIGEAQQARLANVAANPGAHDCAGDRRRRDPKPIGDSPEAETGGIEFDRVHAVRVVQFSGHVFNLSTEHGYFTIDGLFTGNTIFRTNVTNAYAAGRVAQQSSPAVIARMPYWQIRGVGDSRQRPTHKVANGIILPANHPFWRRAYPPLGFGCRCRAISRSQRWMDANNAAIGPEPRDLPDPGFDSGTNALPSVPASLLAEPPATTAPQTPVAPIATQSGPARSPGAIPVALPFEGPSPASREPIFAPPAPPRRPVDRQTFEHMGVTFPGDTTAARDASHAAFDGRAVEILGTPLDPQRVLRLVGAPHVPAAAIVVASATAAALVLRARYLGAGGDQVASVSQKFTSGPTADLRFEFSDALRKRGTERMALREAFREYSSLGVKSVRVPSEAAGAALGLPAGLAYPLVLSLSAADPTFHVVAAHLGL